MRIRVKHYLTALSLVAFLALPALARTDSATLSVMNPTTIAGKQLQPGNYKLEIQPNQTQLKIVNTDTDRTVAEVPCRWIQIKNAPNTTQVVLDKNQVTEIDFGRKTQAVRID
jgi:hypothetical protein